MGSNSKNIIHDEAFFVKYNYSICKFDIVKLWVRVPNHEIVHTTCSEMGWKFKLRWLSIEWTWFMIPMKLVEPIGKLVCKIMKLSLHFYELILPKEYYCSFIT